MGSNIARYAFALVVVGACVGALVRVATGPDRIKDRRTTAQQVCASTGGTWVKIERDEMCVAAESSSGKRN